MAIIFLIGRVLFGGFFLCNAYGHFKNHVGLTGYARMKHVPIPQAAVIGGGIFLLLGGASLLINRFAILGMILLVLFLVPTTIMMHKFWKEADPQTKMTERISFMKNVALIGALLMMVAIG